ncbi:EAL domain-containing protein [Ochrobactrum soli]|uniref:EAL domain-containing protein n=1 Tax=Ochrobactrum soli TaxID=2448455 RepID=UPI000EF1A969|nr:EAL domain-containing protein [[Ochrobactrum] soli]RLL71603.1 EAL domain-containing protein [[Ochrobactrum] soli]
MATRIHSSRRQILIISACLTAVAGTIALLFFMAWVTWRTATHKELLALNTYADQTVKRALHVFEEARSSLVDMQSFSERRCSDAHIIRMRDQTINTTSIEEIGYFENDILKCTSWGKTSPAVRRAKADFVTSDGLDVTFRLTPSASKTGQMTAIALGDYNALIVPARLIDVPVNGEIATVLLNEHDQVLASRDPFNYYPDDDTSFDANRLKKSGYLVGVSAINGLKAIAIEPRSRLVIRVGTELPGFLFAGLFATVLFLIAVYWYFANRLSPKAELATAINNRNLIVEYQPIIDLSSGTCVGAEALVRWRMPDGTLVRPDLFIPLAEETGLIVEITDQVIDLVIAELGDMLADDKTMHIAVNISSSDIQSGRVLHYLRDKLHSTGIENNQIWLEATERGFLEIDSARATIDQAREIGHAIAIDDFGTGYSSLQYLQSLNLDAIKIDKSFVDTIGQAPAKHSVILHIIDLIHALELVSVAEGVETEEQAAFLREHGVAYAQGWLFAKPLPALAFIDFHKRRNENHSAAVA